MKKKQTNDDVLTLFMDFQKSVIQEKPTTTEMFEELQMMRFKIKPVQGDLSILNFKDKQLIEILWNLGKLDEFFQKQYRHLSIAKKRTFYQLFENLHKNYQDQLSALSIQATEEIKLTSTVEMEIFKEEIHGKKVN